MNDILVEALRLNALGFSVWPLKPKDKRPYEFNWTELPRKTPDELEEILNQGGNLGVRLGKHSRIGEHYLGCIDVDIRAPEYREPALAKLGEILQGAVLPEVRSGGGNDSKHLYFLSKTPFPQKKIWKEKGKWEIVAYSQGSQMVLPPSIHPKTGKPYVWSVGGPEDIALFDIDAVPAAPKREIERKGLKGFKPVDLDIELTTLPEKVVNLIVEGKDSTDRSAECVTVCREMLAAGFTDNDILSVLTNRSYHLGETAYDHRKTGDRAYAADWVFKYCLEPARPNNRAARAFDSVEDMGETPLVDPKGAPDILAGVDNWRSRIICDKYGKPKDFVSNAHLILDNALGKNPFRYNSFAKRDELWVPTPWGNKVGEEFQERDIQKIKLWMSQSFRLELGDNSIWSAIINIADRNAYHPIQEYFEHLPPWDGVPRVDGFLEHYLKGSAPRKYMEAVSRKTLVAMVARIYQPGVKFDTMLVLEGAQGLRKSTAVEALASKPWFSDANLTIKSKDSIADMAGKWVLEQGEMNVMSQHDVAELKQFLSRNTDRMRPSYGRKSQDYPRQCIFIGTTNEDIYLKDKSGARRFWPILITGECDTDGIMRDRDQIFAEALMLYRARELIWIPDEETNHLALQQQIERETSDELTTVIEEWIERRVKEATEEAPFDPDSISLVSLWGDAGPFGNPVFGVGRMTMADQKRVGDCLRILGYLRKQVRIDGKNTKKWVKTR